MGGVKTIDMSTWHTENKRCLRLEAALHRMTSKYHESDKRADRSLCLRIALALLWCHTLIILRNTASSRTHLKTKAMCSHKIKTQAGQQNKSSAMCKTGHEHAANENTYKPRVHTRHENMKACSQWKTQAACHTAQDITWMHTANKNTNCVQHKTQHTWTEEYTAERTQDRTLTQQDRTWSTSVRTPKPKLKTWVPGSEHHAPTRNKARRRESACALTWKQDMTGVSGLCHKTMNNTRLKWQNPDTYTHWASFMKHL